MTNLVPVPSEDPVIQIETTTRVLGGIDGPSNLQAQALLNRTAYLRQLLDRISNEIVNADNRLDSLEATIPNLTGRVTNVESQTNALPLTSEGNGIDRIGNGVKRVASFAALQALTPLSVTTTQQVSIDSYYGDGGAGGGVFQWVATSAATEDLGTVVCPTARTTSVSAAALFTGNGVLTTFTGTLANAPIRPGTVTFTAGSVVATDNTAGTLSGTGVTTGTINYTTGAWSVTYTVAPTNLLSATAAYRYAATNGRWKRIFSGPMDVLWFGADPTGVIDSGAKINNCIRQAKLQGGNEIIFSGVFATTIPIVLLAGTKLNGGIGIGYYAGLTFYADTQRGDLPKGAIRAAPGFSGSGLVVLEDVATNGSDAGYSLDSLLILPNKIATRGIYGVFTNLTERLLRARNVNVAGANGDGIYLANCVSAELSNVICSANNGYGINLAFGVSDTVFTDCYLHTNESGGFSAGDGSVNNQISGGKIEDNYGPGVRLFQSAASSTELDILGTTFQSNNGPSVSVNGVNARVFSTGARYLNSAATGTGTSTDAHIYATGRATATVRGGEMDSSPNYAVSTENGAVITVGGDVRWGGNAGGIRFTATNGRVRRLNAYETFAGVLPLRNRGSRIQAVTISASSSGNVTFTGVFEPQAAGLNQSFYDNLGYRLTIQHAPFPTISGSRVIASYLISLPSNGPGVLGSVGMQLLSPTPDPLFIASVTASVSGADITVTVNTGASVGGDGASTTFALYIEDIGSNQRGWDGQ